jgi:hypothetical protein
MSDRALVRGIGPGSRQRRLVRAATTAAVALVVALGAPAGGVQPARDVNTFAAGASMVGPKASVPPAHCGPGSVPEHGVQGEVPLKDRHDGRSQLGYRCNLVLLGQHQGQGAGWQNAWYGHCDYYDTKTGEDPSRFPNGNGNVQKVRGVQVLDVSNPRHPHLTTHLDTPAMDGPWESMKVNQKRGLLAGVGGFGVDGEGPLYFDVYDVKHDCEHPKLLSSTPVNAVIGHEGNWAPDGKTYYSGTSPQSSAIDVTDPRNPRLVTFFPGSGHGLGVSPDGKLLYGCASAGGQAAADPTDPATAESGSGLIVTDVSEIQDRRAAPVTTPVGHVFWSDGGVCQHFIPVFYGKKAFVVGVDEGAGACCGNPGTPGLDVGGDPAGAARLIDVADPANPKIVSVLRLAIQTPKYYDRNQADIAGDGLFGYEAHYCAVDRQYNPTAVACGYFQSGIRVFDIRDPFHPREIAYFNPPAQATKHGTLNGSEHDGGSTNSQPPNDTTDWCTSQIRFYTALNGTHELWAQCQDNGFMTLKFTNHSYPLPRLR